MLGIFGDRLQVFVYFYKSRVAMRHKMNGRVVVCRTKLIDYHCAVRGDSHNDYTLAIILLADDSRVGGDGRENSVVAILFPAKAFYRKNIKYYL